jgi:hypothetical protein
MFVVLLKSSLGYVTRLGNGRDLHIVRWYFGLKVRSWRGGCSCHTNGIRGVIVVVEALSVSSSPGRLLGFRV